MIRLRILVAGTALSLMLGGAALAPAVETITIYQRFNYMVCAGFCVDRDLVVRSDGRVEFRIRPMGHSWRYSRYRMRPDQIAGFRSALAGLRPIGTPSPIGNCHDPEFVKGVMAYEIRWKGGGPDGRLRSCHGEGVGVSVLRGHLALGIDQFGRRMSEEEMRDFASRIP